MTRVPIALFYHRVPRGFSTKMVHGGQPINRVSNDCEGTIAGVWRMIVRQTHATFNAYSPRFGDVDKTRE